MDGLLSDAMACQQLRRNEETLSALSLLSSRSRLAYTPHLLVGRSMHSHAALLYQTQISQYLPGHNIISSSDGQSMTISCGVIFASVSILQAWQSDVCCHLPLDGCSSFWQMTVLGLSLSDCLCALPNLMIYMEPLSWCIYIRIEIVSAGQGRCR